MDQAEKEIVLHPVGVVRTGPGEVQRIEIYERVSEALDGIERAEGLWVLYWMHRLNAQDREVLRVHPRGDPMIPKRGVFSTHSPVRPNPIGMTEVRLLRREGDVLFVEGLDASDGSPVLDLKLAGAYPSQQKETGKS